MTAFQAKCVELYDSGYTVRQIAQITGRPRSTVHHNIIKAMNPSKGNSVIDGVCGYSPCCFTCPLPDCKIDLRHANVNQLRIGFDYAKEVEGI